MKKEFKFKENQSNIEKLFSYAKHKFPKFNRRLDYDEWGQFIFFKKNEQISIFYYIGITGDLNFNVYKDQIAKIDKPIIRDFKHKVYSDEKLKIIFDKILKPVSD